MSDRPLPQPDDDLVAAFRDFCAKEELRFQRCTPCGTWRHLPRLRCAKCGSPEFTWERSSGRGRVWSRAWPARARPSCGSISRSRSCSKGAET